MANSLFFNVTLGFSINNILVAIAAILSIIYIEHGVCIANGIHMAEAITLLIVTLLLLLISSYTMYGLKTYTFEKVTISALMCISVLWLTQYALIIHSFIAFCDTSSPLFIIFFIWTIIYSLAILIGIILVIFGIKMHFGVGIALLSTFGIIVFIIAILATVAQIYLLSTNQCNYEAVSMSEAIFLLIFVLLSICLAVLPFTLLESIQQHIKIILCAEFILLAFQYGIVNHAIDVWGSSSIHCGTYEALQEATFILMIMWSAAYSLILLFMCCGGILYCCGQIDLSD